MIGPADPAGTMERFVAVHCPSEEEHQCSRYRPAALSSLDDRDRYAAACPAATLCCESGTPHYVHCAKLYDPATGKRLQACASPCASVGDHDPVPGQRGGWLTVPGMWSCLCLGLCVSYGVWAHSRRATAEQTDAGEKPVGPRQDKTRETRASSTNGNIFRETTKEPLLDVR